MTRELRGEWTSASNALADRRCRGRHQAQVGLPELSPTEASEAGTVIHALWTGNSPPREPTADELEKAEALREQEQGVAERFFGPGAGLVRLVERRLWHELPTHPDEPEGSILKTSGQFDITLVHPESRRALICDGKSGWLPVTPNPSNLQLRRLAALVWLQLDSREIGVCILKPFAKTEEPCVYSVPDLERAVGEMEEDVRLSHAPDVSRTAGEEQCRYCRARDGCPTRLAWLSAVLPAALTLLPMVSARDWTPAQRLLFLEREREARDWLAARKEELKVLVSECPDSVPGYRLRPGRIFETITDSFEVLRRFCDRLGGTSEAFSKCLTVNKTALKDQVRLVSGNKGKALEAQLATLLAGCVESKPTAPTLERGS